jgi:hypothetical protein
LSDLKQFLEHTNPGSSTEEQSGVGTAKLTTDLASQQLLNSREGAMATSHKSSALNAMLNQSDVKVTTPKKEVEASANALSAQKSIGDDSTEKFKQNEKNLKEERLKKESKIDLSLTLENRKIVKSTTPARDGGAEDDMKLVDGGPGAATKDDNNTASINRELNSGNNLKRNISQNQFTSRRTQDMTESEGSILFKTENNRLKKMMGSCEEQGPTSLVQ